MCVVQGHDFYRIKYAAILQLFILIMDVIVQQYDCLQHALLSQAFSVIIKSKYENCQELRVLSRSFSLFLSNILHCLLSALQIRIILQKVREGLFKTIHIVSLTSIQGQNKQCQCNQIPLSFSIFFKPMIIMWNIRLRK